MDGGREELAASLMSGDILLLSIIATWFPLILEKVSRERQRKHGRRFFGT